MTAGLTNPYEPWVEIMEHGGYFQAEHGQFVDIYGSDAVPSGFVFLRHA